MRSNIRKLEGSLLRAASYASLTRKPLTTESLEYLLRDTIEQENQTALTIEGIQRMVAEYYDIRLGDMTSKQRPQNIAFPRQVAMYLCREMTDQSLPAIGNSFARNHATVLHAHRSVGGKMKTDSGLAPNHLVVAAASRRSGGPFLTMIRRMPSPPQAILGVRGGFADCGQPGGKPWIPCGQATGLWTTLEVVAVGHRVGGAVVDSSETRSKPPSCRFCS